MMNDSQKTVLIVSNNENQQHDAARSMNSSTNSITQHNENQPTGDEDKYWASTLPVQPSSGKRNLVEPTVLQGLISIVKSSWLNLLLVFIPFAWASHIVWSPTVTFILNFVAIIPLAKLLSFATEDIALRTDQVIGAILNATFGNAVEFIISVISLTQNLVVVVQASMLGSILSSLLLILGMSFFVGGCRYKEQAFNMTAAQTSALLLFISVVSLLLPAAFYGATVNAVTTVNRKADILNISRATSIILLAIYVALMVFQLKTHKSLFLQMPVEAFKVERQVPFLNTSDELCDNMPRQPEEEDGYATVTQSHHEEEENPSMPWWMAVLLLLVITTFVIISAKLLVSAIEQVVEQWHISETFVGLILIPIIGNAAEHVTAVTVAYKNKMNLALGATVGSSIQVALLVTPILVIIGWIINVEMSLFFNIYETAVLFSTVILVNYLVVDGKSNWLEGFMLCALYILIVISFYHYPDHAARDFDGMIPYNEGLGLFVPVTTVYQSIA